MIEKVLGVIILLGLLIRDLFGYNTDNIIMIAGSIMAIAYLVANWWLNKPNETNGRTVIVTIVYGIASSSLAFALIFQLLYLTGSQQMTVLSFGIVAFSLLLDFILSIKKNWVINGFAKWRLSILSIFAIILFLVPIDFRISITYRDNPNFLKCYEANKESYGFDTIRRVYLHHDLPDIELKNCQQTGEPAL